MVMLILALALGCGFASMWAGAEGTEKNWRRLLIPGISALFGILINMNLWYICLMARAGALSLGYGLPTTSDKGSAIGRFWAIWFRNNMTVHNAFVRGTIGFVKGVSILVVPILSQHWIHWIFAIILLMINNMLWGAWIKKEGSIELFGKKLLWEEFAIEAIDAFIILELILLCK